MHPRDNKHPSTYVKTKNETLLVLKNPIATHLSKTGLDTDDLAAAAGISKIRILKLLTTSESPKLSECYMLDIAFQFPQGTISEDYDLWNKEKPLSSKP